MGSSIAYVSLGSNVGDRAENLTTAIRLLGACDGVTIERISSVYQTSPIGAVAQQDFLNIVIRVATSLEPRELLSKAHDVERALKRERIVHWGPRTIDVDILLYDETTVDEADLKIPHPEMLERAFVLVPLAEIEPELVIHGRPVPAYIEAVRDQVVEKIGSLS